nr:hypothetical protein CFP56_74126 [Quercus suber]
MWRVRLMSMTSTARPLRQPMNCVGRGQSERLLNLISDQICGLRTWLPGGGADPYADQFAASLSNEVVHLNWKVRRLFCHFTLALTCGAYAPLCRPHSTGTKLKCNAKLAKPAHEVAQESTSTANATDRQCYYHDITMAFDLKLHCTLPMIQYKRRHSCTCGGTLDSVRENVGNARMTTPSQPRSHKAKGDLIPIMTTKPGSSEQKDEHSQTRSVADRLKERESAWPRNGEFGWLCRETQRNMSRILIRLIV